MTTTMATINTIKPKRRDDCCSCTEKTCARCHCLRTMIERPNIINTCSCGRWYTRERWNELDFCGVSELGGVVLEQRHCPCGSTRAIVVSP